MRLLKPALSTLLAGLLPAAFVVAGLPSPAAADNARDCANPTRTESGGSAAAFTVAAGEVVLLTGGSYPGGVNEFQAGATICVAGDATFQPAYVNNAAGTLAVRGTATLPGMSVNAGFELSNEGKTTLTGSFNQNGTATLTNAAGAELVSSGPFVLSGGSVLTNAGAMTAPSVTTNASSPLHNSGELTTDQLVASGPIHNTGRITVNGSFTTNGGGSLKNECLIDVQSGWQNDDQAHNFGRITIASGALVNQGLLVQSPTGLIQGADFINDTEVAGFGRYRFTGETDTQGSFAGDTASDPIVFWDATSSGEIFDISSGVVDNVVRSEVDAETGESGEPAGCESVGTVPADLRVAKTGPATVEPGGIVTYTVTVANLGAGAAEAVTLTDALPPELSSVSASNGGTVADGKVTWTVADLADGDTLTFTVTGTAPGSGSFDNVVSGTSGTDDPDPTNNDGSSDSARVTTTVDEPPPVNHPPVAENQQVGVAVNTPAVGAVPVSDPDEGQTVEVTLSGEQADGTATVSPDGGFSYVPDDDFTGMDRFDVEACDNGTPVLCGRAAVIVTVSPIAEDDAATTRQDTPVAIPVRANDSGTTLAPEVTQDPASGTVTAGPDESFVYTPAPGFTGTDTFHYRICSPSTPSVCDDAGVTVTVGPPNQLPSIGGDEFTERAGHGHQAHVESSDPDPGQTVTVRLDSPPKHGTAVVEPNGDYTYQPSPGYSGDDSFTMVACDDGEPPLCATGKVIVHLTPIANDDQATTPKDTPVSLDIGRNDLGTVDPATITVQPEHGSAQLQPAPDPTSAPQSSPTGTPRPSGDGSGSVAEADLPRTGAEGLGTVLFAALAITGLGILCLIVGFKVSRREEE